MRTLTEDELCAILTDPQNALLKQYQLLFRMDDAKLEFSAEAVREIAHKALDIGTGARGLRSVVEDLMLDLMFDLPDEVTAGRKDYVISAADVTGKQPQRNAA